MKNVAASEVATLCDAILVKVGEAVLTLAGCDEFNVCRPKLAETTTRARTNIANASLFTLLISL